MHQLPVWKLCFPDFCIFTHGYDPIVSIAIRRYSMLYRYLSVYLTTLLFLGLSSGWALAEKRFAVFADPHYYDSQLGTEGAAFEAYLMQDRKLLRESEALTRAVVDNIIEAHHSAPIDFVIVVGDLTKDGELTSHLEFADYLGILEAEGIEVFVVPGNHDVNNPHAVAFEGETMIPVDNVSPEEFASIYGAYGYDEAFSRAPDSLSYAVEVTPGVVLLGLDTCKYDENLSTGHPETSGALSPRTLSWTLDRIKAAKRAGKQVISFQHHGLMEHYTGQTLSFADYVIDDWQTVSTSLADAGLKLAFSGHYHANDITELKGSVEGAKLYDVETGSLVTAPCPYRIVTLHKRNAAQIETRWIEEIDYDIGDLSFQDYGAEFLYNGLLGIAEYTLMVQYGLPQDEAAGLAPVVANAFIAHYYGDEQPDEETMAFISGLLQAEDSTTQFLGQMLYSLWTDLAPSDGRALLSLEPAIELQPLGTYFSGVFDEGAAEIVAYDPKTQQLFVTNADANAIDVINAADPENPVKAFSIDLSPYGGGVNSVAVKNGIIAAAVEADPKQGPGQVIFFSTKGKFLKAVTVGSLPDMLCFTPNGKKVLVANEGEPNDDYTLDPEGSVSIIDISRGVKRARVKTAGFKRFNRLKDELQAAGVRIYGPGASVAQDLEPEYITVAKGSSVAWVSLQENNGLALLHIPTGRIKSIMPLGVKNHNFPGFGLDASNKDNAINISTYANLLGMFQPDAIASYRSKGRHYLVTANEGDSRDYDGFSEEERVKDLELNEAYFDPAVQDDEVLGRLKVTTTLGDWDNDNIYEELYAYGGRSFSIFKSTPRGLRLVFDSGDQLEQITAAALPRDFNSTNDENDSFDNRSDDKGPEPEGLVLGKIGNRTYLFLGLERVGGIMVYDITRPQKPEFVQYLNNRDFSGNAEEGTAGDLAPEGLAFIPAAKSPTGDNLLAVANEVSGTTTLYKINVNKRCNIHPRWTRGHQGHWH